MKTSDATASLNRSIAARAAKFYAAFASVWILVSDGAAHLFGTTTLAATALNIAKGELFVAVTGGALYLFMTRWGQERWLEKQMLNQRLSQLSTCANDIILLIGDDGSILDANDRAVEAYGRPLDELLRMGIGDLRAETNTLDWRGQWETVVREGNVRFEALHLRRDGTLFPVEVSARKIARGDAWAVQSIIRDISERKEAERQILRLRDVYAALSQTNQCIVRVGDRTELFRTICDIAIRYGHFRMAWIGLIDTGTRTVVPVEAAGEDTAALADVHVPIDPGMPLAGGTSSRAVITLASSICNDVEASEEIRGSHPWTIRNGCRSVAAFPLFCRGTIVGVLSLYATEPGFFRDDLVHLLEEMAGDISYALDRMDLEAERHRTNFEMQKLLTAVEQSPVTMVVTDTEGTIEYVDPAFTADRKSVV